MVVSDSSPARSGAAGLEEILEGVRPGAMRMLRRYRIPEDDFEDILQETFLIFILRQPAVDQPERWLIGTLRNRCLMFWRQRQRNRALIVNSRLVDGLADPRLSRQQRSDLLRDLKKLLARLPTRYRRVLETRYLLGLSPAETARRLGYRESGIYKIIERGKNALAEEMKREGFDEEKAWSA